MNATTCPGWLLAQVSREEFGRAFRGATSQLHWTDLIPYAVAAVVGIVGAALYRHLKRRNDMSLWCDDAQKLFRELCLVHQLDRHSQRLLAQLADAWKFPQPAQVFLTPAAFDRERLPDSLRAKATELDQLRQRLF